jgi:hypothetical protein
MRNVDQSSLFLDAPGYFKRGKTLRDLLLKEKPDDLPLCSGDFFARDHKERSQSPHYRDPGHGVMVGNGDTGDPSLLTACHDRFGLAIAIRGGIGVNVQIGFDYHSRSCLAVPDR